jgi:hypothetical protein
MGEAPQGEFVSRKFLEEGLVNAMPVSFHLTAVSIRSKVNFTVS